MRCCCRPEARKWSVIRRRFSCSAFNGYRPQWSAYSDVECGTCGRQWRTKAAYTNALPNSERAERWERPDR